MSSESHRDLLISYTTLRKLVGILGISLPVVLLLGNIIFGDCTGPQRSISHNYHTMMGDVFVGLLSAIALFLFVYKGPEPIDGILGNVAGILGTLVALIPCKPHNTDPGYLLRGNFSPDYWLGSVHDVTAGIFLLVLAYFSIKLFTKTREGETPTPQKKTRNTIYRICGWIMVLCVIGCVITLLVVRGKEPEPEWLLKFTPVFWLETIALWAFGFAWLVKGETLWRDRA